MDNTVKKVLLEILTIPIRIVRFIFDNPRACRGCLPREHPWRHIAYPQDYRTLDAQRAMHRRYNPGAHHTLWGAWKWATTPRDSATSPHCSSVRSLP